MVKKRILIVLTVVVIVAFVTACTVPQSAKVTVRNYAAYSIVADVDGDTSTISSGSSKSFTVDWDAPLGGEDKDVKLKAYQSGFPDNKVTRKVTLSDGDEYVWELSSS